MRYLGELGNGLAQIGAFGAARTAFEIVIASQASFLVRTNAMLELMELESGVDNRVAFERLRAEAESVRERMPPSMMADYLYKVGVGLARFGKVARAREVLSEGLRRSEASGLNAWYFRIERTLQNLTSGVAACHSRAHASSLGRPERAAGRPGSSARAPRVCPVRGLVVGALPSSDAAGAIGRAGRVAAGAGGGEQGQGQRGEREPGGSAT